MSSFLDQFGDQEATTVTEYTRRIKRLLESSVPPEWIQGEVSNFRRQASGHLYFSLKDENAQLPVVMFRGNASGLDFEIEDGMELLVFGELSVYEPHGRYQLIARAAVEAGRGKLHREFERLKKKLLDEGLFDKERKRRLPALPRRVAFITSPTGAAVQDFIRILKRRDWKGRLTILPAKVQGPEAAQTLMDALSVAARLDDLDLLVVGRGGGSMEDLWCFNNEPFVRALAQSPAPTISAVGHEIDFSLSDFVADIRAETPSAAAELISSSFLEYANRLTVAGESLDQYAGDLIAGARAASGELRIRLKAVAPQRTLENAKLRLDELIGRLRGASRECLAGLRERAAKAGAALWRTRPELSAAAARRDLEALRARFLRASERRLAERKQALQETNLKFRSLSPDSTLKRGYAILTSECGSVIHHAEALRRAPRVRATVEDGEVWLSPETTDP